MRRKRDNTAGNTLSFLDVISCGFGAVVLLLIITKPVIEDVIAQQQHTAPQVSRLEELKLITQRQENNITAKEKTLKGEQRRLQSLKDRIEKEAESWAGLATENKIRGQMAAALQEIDEEMRQLQLQSDDSNAVGGIPADSRHIIFIVDTSGSMQQVWPSVVKELTATLSSYPKIEGFQILDDMGEHLFPGYRGRWIPDTPGRRKATIKSFRSWSSYSNSNPQEGIVEAMKTYGRKSKRASIYIFGDEFSGSAQGLINRVASLNKTGADGKQLFRIHAIGFDASLNTQGKHSTFEAFATVMRELTQRNGGSFIGIR